MNYLSIDYLILYAFLAIVLIVGYRAGRNVKDMRDFAVGGGKYGAFLLVLTYLATDIGGGAVFEGVAWPFSIGIIGTVVDFGLFVPYLFRALWIAPKMQYFKSCNSIAEVMGVLYGKSARIFTGVIGSLYSMCVVAFGFSILSIVCRSILGINPTYGLFFIGIILAAYTSHGGIRSVAATDVIQFVSNLILILLIAVLIIYQVGGLKSIFEMIPKDRLEVLHHKQFSYWFPLFLLWSIFSVGITDPPIFQRLLIAKDATSIKKQYISISLADPIIRTILMIIGLGALVLYPTIESNNILPHIIGLLPEGLKGIAMCGIVAVIMGCVDSHLHVAGVILINDVFNPICNRNKNYNDLNLVKYAIIFITLFAILLTLNALNIIEIYFEAVAFMGPVLAFPLIVGILGLKPDKASFFIALITTVITFFLFKSWLPERYGSYVCIISIITNIVTFLTSHYIQNKGFAVVMRDKSKCNQKPLEFEIFNPFHLAAYARTKAEQFGTPYIAFGTFFLIAFGVILLFWDVIPKEYFVPVLWLKLLGGIMCVSVMIEEKWYDSFKKYLPLFWYITLGFALPFIGMLMLLITNGDIQWLIQLGMGMVILPLFIDTIGYLAILILGIIAALLVYVCWLKASIYIDPHIESPYSILWQIFFGVCAFVYFLRNRQKEWEKFHLQHAVLGVTYRRNLLQTAQESSRMAKALENAGVGGLCNVAIKIKKSLDEASTTLDKSSPFLAELQKATSELTTMALEVRDIEQRAVEHLLLTVTTDSVTDMINNVMCDLDSLNAKENVSFYNKSKKKTIECDFEKIRTVLTNSVIFARSFVQDEEIHVVVDDAILSYYLNTAENRTMHLDAIRFTISTPEYPKVEADLITYKSEMQPIQIEIPKKEVDLPLLQNKRIIRAHYGFYSSEIDKDECKQIYVIPQDLRKVRPAEMDKGEMLLAEDEPSPKFNSTAERKELELIDKIKHYAPKVKVERVKTAIKYIKKSHATTNRLSGEPFYLHPIAVANIVMDYDCSEDTIIGALLHDTIEDTATNAEVITLLFGEKVATIVIDLTNIECNIGSCYRLKLSSVDNILQLLAVRDKRSLYIKIADRLHNLRTISHKDVDNQLRKAEETILFYVPLAEQLEMKSAAGEMRDISVKVLNKGR